MKLVCEVLGMKNERIGKMLLALNGLINFLGVNRNVDRSIMFQCGFDGIYWTEVQEMKDS